MNTTTIDVRTICPKCASVYEDSGYLVERLYSTKPHSPCMICGNVHGSDYSIAEKKAKSE